MGDDASTRERILASAKMHFLRSGFKDASLRQIVADAGFTTGAFYGYFSSKEDLFYALTDPVAAALSERLAAISAGTSRALAAGRIDQLGGSFAAVLPELVDVLFDDADAARLLFTCAQGTKYEDFLGAAMQRNESVFTCLCEEYDLGIASHSIQILNQGYYAMLVQAFLDGSSKEDAIKTAEDIQLVFTQGMFTLLNQAKDQAKGESGSSHGPEEGEK